MSLREQIEHELDRLDAGGLGQVARYLAFLRFEARAVSPPEVDESLLANLYAEFDAEDHALAEEGMAEYSQGLAGEDIK